MTINKNPLREKHMKLKQLNSLAKRWQQKVGNLAWVRPYGKWASGADCLALVDVYSVLPPTEINQVILAPIWVPERTPATILGAVRNGDRVFCQILYSLDEKEMKVGWIRESLLTTQMPPPKS